MRVVAIKSIIFWAFSSAVCARSVLTEDVRVGLFVTRGGCYWGFVNCLDVSEAIGGGGVCLGSRSASSMSSAWAILRFSDSWHDATFSIFWSPCQGSSWPLWFLICELWMSAAWCSALCVFVVKQLGFSTIWVDERLLRRSWIRKSDRSK